MKGRVREKGGVWVEFQNGQTLVKKPEDTAFQVRGGELGHSGVRGHWHTQVE